MSIFISLIHKNEDAEQKWCPYSGTTGCGHDNKNERLLPGGLCLTTGCMAWIDETDHRYEVPMGRCGLVTNPRN